MSARTRSYSCGCSAVGARDLPVYCPQHPDGNVSFWDYRQAITCACGEVFPSLRRYLSHDYTQCPGYGAQERDEKLRLLGYELTMLAQKNGQLQDRLAQYEASWHSLSDGADARVAEARREERLKVLMFLFEHGRLTRKEVDRLDAEMDDGPPASAPEGEK